MLSRLPRSFHHSATVEGSLSSTWAIQQKSIWVCLHGSADSRSCGSRTCEAAHPTCLLQNLHASLGMGWACNCAMAMWRMCLSSETRARSMQSVVCREDAQMQVTPRIAQAELRQGAGKQGACLTRPAIKPHRCALWTSAKIHMQQSLSFSSTAHVPGADARCWLHSHCGLEQHKPTASNSFQGSLPWASQRQGHRAKGRSRFQRPGGCKCRADPTCKDTGRSGDSPRVVWAEELKAQGFGLRCWCSSCVQGLLCGFCSTHGGDGKQPLTMVYCRTPSLCHAQ